MKPTKHMSETELREEIATLRAARPIGITGEVRLRDLWSTLERRIVHRYMRMRDEEVRVQVVRLQRRREKATDVIVRRQIEDELRLALRVAQLRGVGLINDPPNRRLTRRELHFHSLPPEQLQRALGRMRTQSKAYQIAVSVATARGIEVES